MVYLCGCDADTAGSLTFVEGRMVCPLHLQPPAPTERPDVWRGSLTIACPVQAGSREEFDAWLSSLSDGLAGHVYCDGTVAVGVTDR